MSSRQQRRAQAKAERAASASKKPNTPNPQGNRELRRFAAKEEERARRRRKAPQQTKRERVGFQQFIREVRQELKKVAWPTRAETTTYTVVVLVTTVVLTAYTFGLDFLFKRGVLQLLGS